MAEVDVEVAVVGAGLAGLTAARRLHRADRRVAVIEARDRVGGRTLTRDEGAYWLDLGGQWIGPTQTRVRSLVDELGLTTFKTHTQGENLVEWDSRLRRYTGTIPKLDPLGLADVGQALLRLDRMAKDVPTDAPWTAPDAMELDAQTVWSWMQRGMRTDKGRQLLTLAVNAVFAVEPQDLSLLHLLFYANAAGGMDALVDTEGGAQDSRIVGGTQQLSDAMAVELGDRVHRGHPARRIIQRDDRVRIEADGLTVDAHYVIVAIPPTLAGRLEYEPRLPAARDQLTQRMPQGTVIKCHAVYDEPFWRAAGLSGAATSNLGPVKVVFDNSPPGGEVGILMGFLEGQAARDLGGVTPAERRAFVLEVFERLFGPRAARPEHYLDKSWADDEYARGCYGAVMVPGGWTGFGPALRQPVGLIHWAGAETATTWSGYMDGAVRSGERAAAEVTARLLRRKADEPPARAV